MNYDSLASARLHIRPRLYPDNQRSRDNLSGCSVFSIPDTTLLLGFVIEDEEGSRQVTNEDLAAWHATLQDIYESSMLHGCTPDSVVIPMSQAIGAPQSDEDVSLYVVSNHSGHYGASAILYPETKISLSEIFPNGYCIIPSSIHEVIVLPKDSVPVNEILQMVKDINAAEVSPEDFLADDVYLPDETYGLRSAVTASVTVPAPAFATT